MKFFQKIKDWLKNLHGFLFYALLILSIEIITMTIVFVVTDNNLFYFVYLFYVASLVALAYIIYAFIKICKSSKRKFVNLANKNKHTKKIVEDYELRKVLSASVSFTINTAYAIYMFILSILASSVWYGSLASYYMMLSVMRGTAVYKYMKFSRQDDGDNQKLKMHLAFGIMLVILTIVFITPIVIMVTGDQSFKYAGLMIYVAALYAFYKIIVSIINLVKSRKTQDYLVRSVININLADALVSILALQTAMFQSFAQGLNVRVPNTITSIAVCFLIIGIGVTMITTSVLKFKKINKENENG